MGDDFVSGRRWHDMGGDLDRLRALRGEDAVEISDHDHAIWEKRIDALMVLLSAKGLITVDSLRRALEDMGEDAFEKLSYYDRWAQAVTQNLIDNGHLTIEELRARMQEVSERGETYGQAAAPDRGGDDG